MIVCPVCDCDMVEYRNHDPRWGDSDIFCKACQLQIGTHDSDFGHDHIWSEIKIQEVSKLK